MDITISLSANFKRISLANRAYSHELEMLSVRMLLATRVQIKQNETCSMQTSRARAISYSGFTEIANNRTPLTMLAVELYD